MLSIKQIYYGFIIRPLLVILLGLRARNIALLPEKGPHLVAANHNSHLDAMVLMSLFKLSHLGHVKVVADKAYFCRNPLMTWFSINVIGIIPIDKSGNATNPIAPVLDALDDKKIVILFPEGTRGEPEIKAPLKYGIAKVLEERPHVTITPVFMYGLGKSLPKGKFLLVPFLCDVNVGEPIAWGNDRTQLIKQLETSFDALSDEIGIKSW